MIKMVGGDILESSCQAIANPVNCVGVMGKGLALEFKKKFPRMFADYKDLCSRGEIVVGKPCLLKNQTPWILLFPTKRHWKEASKIEYILDGLDYISLNLDSWNLKSLALPLLGTGLGGLRSSDVIAAVEKRCASWPIPVEFFSLGANHASITDPKVALENADRDELPILTRAHIEFAMARIDKEGVPKSRVSTRYHVVHDGKLYPPKYVISLAVKEARGTEARPNEFSGGKQTNDFLRKYDFEIRGPKSSADKHKRKN